MDEEKRSVGRPTKYKPEFCEIIEKDLAMGYSKEAACGGIGITKETMYQWIKTHPEFSDAIRRGELKSIRHYESRLIAHGSGKKMDGFDQSKSNLNAIIFPLKTRFHRVYGERQKIETTEKSDNEKQWKLAYDSTPKGESEKDGNV